MESRLPIEQRIVIMPRDLWEGLRSRDWTKFAIPDGQ